MYELDLINYNFHRTLLGGQSHLWTLNNNQFIYSGQWNIFIINSQSKLNTLEVYPQNSNYNIQDYLNLNQDYEKILKSINIDEFTDKAIAALKGLRLLNQPFEETVLTFILSQHKNIKAIRYSVEKLKDLFGESVVFNGKKFKLFPKTETLADVSIENLLETGIGFRAKYLKTTAQRLVKEKIKDHIGTMNELEARQLLTSFYGIGDKVADCIMSFSLKFNNVTPLDVWSIRILQNLYGLNPKYKYSDYRKWSQDYFNGYAAWAGHFLWEYYRDEGRKELVSN